MSQANHHATSGAVENETSGIGPSLIWAHYSNLALGRQLRRRLERGKGKTNLVLIKQIGLINVFMPCEVPKLTERRITIL